MDEGQSLCVPDAAPGVSMGKHLSTIKDQSRQASEQQLSQDKL